MELVTLRIEVELNTEHQVHKRKLGNVYVWRHGVELVPQSFFPGALHVDVTYGSVVVLSTVKHLFIWLFCEEVVEIV